MIKLKLSWNKLSLFKRTAAVALMALCLTLFANALNLDGKPNLVKLINADIQHIAMIHDYLETNDIEHYVHNETQIFIDEKIRAQTLLKLASENLITPDMENKIERLKTINELEKQRYLQLKIEELIQDSCDKIERVHVVLQLNPFQPSACVKLVLKEDIPVKSLIGIQRLVAISVDQLSPEKVVIVNNDNVLLNDVIEENVN